MKGVRLGVGALLVVEGETVRIASYFQNEGWLPLTVRGEAKKEARKKKIRERKRKEGNKEGERKVKMNFKILFEVYIVCRVVM